jgi:hypothetical protein
VAPCIGGAGWSREAHAACQVALVLAFPPHPRPAPEPRPTMLRVMIAERKLRAFVVVWRLACQLWCQLWYVSM